MSVIRYLSDLWACRARAAALAAQIEEGRLTPIAQVRAVEALLATVPAPLAPRAVTGAVAA